MWVAGIFYEGCWAAEFVCPDAVQFVVVTGIIVKGEIKLHGLFMDKLMNMILHLFGLGRAHTFSDTLEDFTSYQHQSHGN